MMLKIDNLHVWVKERKILNGVSFSINNKEIHTLVGPNGSGKSTLAKTIMGLSGYKLKGNILFEGRNITNLSISARARLGIFLAYQFPPKVKGIKLGQIIQMLAKGKEIPYFDSHIPSLLSKELNSEISGGEKKISEILQAFVIQPKFLIMDEIDSGLDIKRIKTISKVLKNYFDNKEKIAMLIITHTGEILKYLNPDYVHVMLEGKIVCTSTNWKKVLRTIRRYGYEKCKRCLVHSGKS